MNESIIMILEKEKASIPGRMKKYILAMFFKMTCMDKGKLNVNIFHISLYSKINLIKISKIILLNL